MCLYLFKDFVSKTITTIPTPPLIMPITPSGTAANTPIPEATKPIAQPPVVTEVPITPCGTAAITPLPEANEPIAQPPVVTEVALKSN